MLDADRSRRLTAVSAGTPMGDLLRRYWHPLMPVDSLSPEVPVQTVGILGESLVVFQQKDGQFGAIAERCPHRGVSMAYAFVEHDGLRCPYHGWLFTREGNCPERPFEIRGTGTIRTTAYPVVSRSGLLFIYMGPPESMTPLPRFDILERADVKKEIHLQEDLNCNWLQIQENAADTTHTFYLHSNMMRRLGLPDDSGFDLALVAYGFQPFDWGIVKSWEYQSAQGVVAGWGNLLVFPTILRIETEIHWRVPISDESTRIFILRADVSNIAGEGSPNIVVKKLPRHKTGDLYHMKDFYSQDAMAWETQGAIADRTREHLGASDTGVAMFRTMLESQLERIAAGQNPNLGRAATADEFIDHRKYMGGYLPASAPPDPSDVSRLPRDAIFDERHRVVRLR